MNVEERITSQVPLLKNENVKNGTQAKEFKTQKPISQDQAVNVQISSTAMQKSEDELRMEKLNAIRQQLAAGTYNISGKDVANKILNVLKG
jgi:anti-sigma28 factor (negative regulator of flagellin synthesis)